MKKVKLIYVADKNLIIRKHFRTTFQHYCKHRNQTVQKPEPAVKSKQIHWFMNITSKQSLLCHAVKCVILRGYLAREQRYAPLVTANVN